MCRISLLFLNSRIKLTNKIRVKTVNLLLQSRLSLLIFIKFKNKYSNYDK